MSKKKKSTNKIASITGNPSFDDLIKLSVAGNPAPKPKKKLGKKK